MYCSKCGSKINDAAVICPNCGAATSNYQSESKPKKKKTIGPLIAIFSVTFIVCLLIAIALGSEGENASPAAVNEQTTNSQTESKKDNSKKTYGIGDTFLVKTLGGDYKVTITGVKETSERNELADINPKHVIIVSYSYENVSYSADITVSYLYFRLYDSSNTLMDVYPLYTDQPSQISQGKKHSASIAYCIQTNEKTATLDLYSAYMENVCAFNLSW